MRESAKKKQELRKEFPSLKFQEWFPAGGITIFLFGFLYRRLLKYPDNLFFPWWPQPDLNRCSQLEKLVYWTRLYDGAVLNFVIQGMYSILHRKLKKSTIFLELLPYRLRKLSASRGW